MLFSNDIAHLKILRKRAILPRNKKNPIMDGTCILCNINEDLFNLYLENKILYHDMKYRYLSMDLLYNGKILNKTFRHNYREYITKTLYPKIEKGNDRITCVRDADMIHGKNKYISLLKVNEIFFNYTNKPMAYIKKINEYFRILKEHIDKNRSEHTSLVISIEDWIAAQDGLFKKIRLDDPINMIYFALRKEIPSFKELGDINIYIISNGAIVRLNPKECDKKTHIIFKREINRIHSKYTLSENNHEDDESIEEKVQELKTKLNITKNLTGEISDEIETKVEKKIEDVIKSNSKLSKEDIENELDTDTEFLKEIHKEIMKNKIGKTVASSKRDDELRKKQLEIKLKGTSLKDILDSPLSEIEEYDVSSKVFTTNKNATNIKFTNFEKSYNKNNSKKDIAKILTGLSKNKTIPVYIKDIKVEDSSDELNIKETYSVVLEDENRVRHTLKFDMPVFIEDKFMYLGGNKKLIVKQLFLHPIVKTGPETVQITSNYNKIFVTRHGRKVSPKIEKLLKVIVNPHKGIVVTSGNHKSMNSKYRVTIEYDILSERFDNIKVGAYNIDFSQKRIHEKLNKLNINLKENEMCIGFNGNTPLIMNLDTQLIGEKDLTDIIVDNSPSAVQTEFSNVSVGKKFFYSSAKLLNKAIPVIILTSYFEGLTRVLNKAKINYHFSDTRTRIDSNNEGIIEFNDGYLIYDKYPIENSLLLNAFADIPTKAFSFADMDNPDAYADIFDLKFNSRNLGKDLTTYYEFMIDEITLEMLESLNLPTDLVSVLLYANRLLSDNAHTKEYNLDIYRTRSNEIINAYLHSHLAHAYSQYRQTVNNKNPIKISIPKDAIMKDILTAQTIEDYSTLNPIVELEKSRAASAKGPSGLNVARAYTQEKRSFDKSMLGVIAVSTSPDSNCGVVRQLTLEPNIVGTRGMIQNKSNNLDEIKDVNLFSPAELLSPLGVTRDDTVRTAMASKQSKHIVPVKKSSPVLISNGVEQVVQYHLSSDFVITADDDGKVIERDDENGLIIIEYKDGTQRAINIKDSIVKNGAGGFYLSNKLESDLKVGQKFKKHDILASDKNFFTNDNIFGNRFNIGSLQKVACMSAYSTFEDSTWVTDKLSRDLATKIIMPKEVVLGKNANIDKIVNIGDIVSVGDELLKFELSFEEDSLNKMLSSIGEDLQEEIRSLSKTTIKSSYSGIIKDIEIQSTVDLSELSPSLRKLVSGYYKKVDKRKDVLNKYDNSKSVYKMGILLNEASSKIVTKDGKVNGTEVGEGVRIKFYIEFEDNVGIGDKIVNFTALKSVVGEQVPKGYEPYTEFRPDEEISTFVAPGAVLARMTPSILLTMFGNKVLIELKRKLYKQYTGKEWECNEIE